MGQLSDLPLIPLPSSLSKAPPGPGNPADTQQDPPASGQISETPTIGTVGIGTGPEVPGANIGSLRRTRRRMTTTVGTQTPGTEQEAGSGSLGSAGLKVKGGVSGAAEKLLSSSATRQRRRLMDPKDGGDVGRDQQREGSSQRDPAVPPDATNPTMCSPPTVLEMSISQQQQKAAAGTATPAPTSAQTGVAVPHIQPAPAQFAPLPPPPPLHQSAAMGLMTGVDPTYLAGLPFPSLRPPPHHHPTMTGRPRVASQPFPGSPLPTDVIIKDPLPQSITFDQLAQDYSLPAWSQVLFLEGGHCNQL